MKRYFNQLLLTLLLSVFCLPIFSQTTIFDYGSSWSYYDNQNEPAVQGSLDWNDVSYDDSSWSTGNAHLGYGDDDEVTLINDNTLAAYVRHSFNVADPSVYGSLNLNLTFDDGAVVYLNGVEVWRINMPGGTISYGTFSSSVGTENGTSSIIISDALITGTNVLAVEIHQASSSSSDISFDFKLSGNIAGQVNVNRGPYLQKGTPTSMVVRWRTLTATETVIDYGTSLGNLNQNVSDLTPKVEHEVEITGLSANTIYYYQVSNSATVLIPEANDVFFKTHPITGSSQPFTFWALGDAGTANNNQRAVRDAYYNYIGTNVTDGILFLGDNAYNDGTDSEYQLAVFENMYEDKLKNSVAWSCLGNHDGHSADSNTQTGPYYDIFTFPTAGESGGMASGTEAYYSFDYGNVHFIVLDSYDTDRSVGSAMYNWAQSDIQNTTQEWIIAFWHHPPYTKGSHDSDYPSSGTGSDRRLSQMRENFLPMLEGNGVDLVLSGHSHSYERSYLLNGHYGTSGTFDSVTNTVGTNGDGDGKIDGTGAYAKGASDPEGAVYITAGSSGKVTGTLTNHNAMAVSLYELGSCIVEVDGSTLNVKFIRETGAIDDYFTIEKGCSTVGQPCDDGDACTTNDVYDANCNCAGTVAIDTATGDIETYVGNIIDNAPGNSGDNYVVPNASELTTWNTVLDFILADDLVNARSNACSINYQVTEFTDTSISPNQIFYVLEEKSPQQNYWGTYVFSKTPDRDNLVILAPHSKYDTNTGKEAIHCFKNNVAKAVFINGTHRCNNSIYSTCSGTTGSCGTSGEDYRVSDLAHNTNSMFQKTTENLFTNVPNSVFVQLHGFSKQASDPYVIMSNGTRITPSPDYATLIQDALFVEDNTLTFELAHINTSWTRLIGFTNTQGRLINNSADFCNTSATTTTGRFIHIEQEKTKLRDDVTGWTKMSNALSNAFPIGSAVDSVGVKKVEMNINGNILKIPYYSNYQLSNSNNNVAKAIIVIHGNNRDAGNYFTNMTIAASMRPTETDSTMIIAPQFLTEDDINSFSLDSEHLYWSSGGWKSGSNSKDNLTNPRPERIPSYAVLDTIMLRLAQNFPNLKSIVFTGHSAGGQLTNRYLATTPVVDTLCNFYEVSTKFLVANPSSYLYMDNQRRVSETINQFEVPNTSCTTYNEWKYGLENMYTYPSNVGVDSIRVRMERNQVVYLLGENDNDPNSSSLDLSCEAMLQGDHRLERGTIFFNHLINFYGNSILNKHYLDTVPNVGHSNLSMYTSEKGLFHLFESNPNSCGNTGCTTVGETCDDGDACTINDVYDANCGCAGTFEDSDNDGVCDADDLCPGFDDTIDTNSNGIPDGCENVCSPFVTNFSTNPLTHSGSGSSDATVSIPTDGQDVTFTISGINQKLNGKASRKYIEHVVVTYVDGLGNTQPYDTFSGANVSSVNIDIQEKVQSVTVNLSDELDGSTDSTMDISFSQVNYCINSTPPCTTPDADGDGVCDAEDQCPGQDDALIGTPCDDGDNCTIGETYDNSCNCSGGVFTDNDGDGFCIGDDPDDNNGCNPDSNSGACSPCGDIINDGFESGFGNWNDGGNDCARNASNANTGVYSIRLRDDSSTSNMYSDALDLSSYPEVSFEFSYTANSMESGEDFFLEISSNGGSSYATVQSWVSGTHFNNNTRYNEAVTISGPFAANTVFRLRCDASGNNDQVYIDDVVITDCVGQSLAKSLLSGSENVNDGLVNSIKIYPNPASYTLFIDCSSLKGVGANISLYTITGQLVRNVNLKDNYNPTQKLELDGLSDGIYILRMVNHQGGFIMSKRIIISR